MRTSLLMRPTPKPTKDVMTNSNKSGCPVMVVQKVVIHDTAEFTREVTASRISAMEAPPYTRTSLLMRPIPRPTKATITKVRIRGLEVMAPTKEPTHFTASVTKVVTLVTMVETVTAGVGSCRTPHFKKNYVKWIIARIIRITTRIKAKPTK